MPAPLAVSRLTLTDFRCYERLRVEVDGRPVVLTGPNGAGKTNLLEAISFLVPGRGLRRATAAEVARNQGPGAWAVAAEVVGAEGPVRLGTGIERPVPGKRERRVIHVDGEAVKSQAALAEHLSAQWLTPRMDRLFQDGPPARRRFLDRLVFGFDPAHAGRVAAYEHAMRERNKLLREGKRDPAWLGALEESMAAKGVAVAAARRETASRLATICENSPGPFPGAALRAQGALEDWLGEGPALAAEDRFKEALSRSRQRDAEHGSCALGPHRSDLAVRHLGKDAPAEQCSTGEQKALLIAIVLADARLQAHARGSVPVLLLDEVSAHLDEIRRAALYEEILGLGSQAWLAGTDVSLFEPLKGKATFLRVEEARVTAEP